MWSLVPETWLCKRISSVVQPHRNESHKTVLNSLTCVLCVESSLKPLEDTFCSVHCDRQTKEAKSSCDLHINLFVL